MKNFIFSVIAVLFVTMSSLLYSCNEDESILKESETTKNMVSQKEERSLSETTLNLLFFKENIAFSDARIRTINTKKYVREIQIINFSENDWSVKEFGFDGTLFEDNGLGNDLIANDGIYTSKETFYFNNKIQYNSSEPIRSIMGYVITDPLFKFDKDLQKIINENSRNNGKFKAEITCDVEICSTGCIADAIWDGFGCICFSNCSVTVGFEW